MRFRQDLLLSKKCDQTMKMLLGDVPERDEKEERFKAILKSAFELGFDSGVESCGIYSKALKDLYSGVDMSEFE